MKQQRTNEAVRAVPPEKPAESNGSPEHDARIFDEVTDLFLSNVEHLSESQIGAVDGVLAQLVGRAERDDNLAENLGFRLDMPGNLLRELLSKVADVVGARFLPAPRPVAKKIRGAAAAPAAPRPKIDYTSAQNEVVALNRSGKLNDSVVNRFAVKGEYVNVVAALALKADVKAEAIEPLLDGDRLYGLIVACKAARLSWSTTTMIVRNRPNCKPVTQRELDQCAAVFESLLLSVAQWTIRFGSDRILTKGDPSSAPAAKGKQG